MLPEPTTTTAPSSSRARSTAARILPLVGIVVFFLIAMLAASLSGAPTFTPPLFVEPRPMVAPSQWEAGIVGLVPPGGDQPPEILAQILGIALAVLVVGVVGVLVVIAVRRLVAWLKGLRFRGSLRDLAQPEVEVTGAVIEEPRPQVTVIQRGIAAARARIRGHGDPGDAIVAAWLGLEETAADAGMVRGLSETPAEFTLRVLRRHGDIDAPTRSLLAMYERVRFGGRVADEADRAAAASALAAIEEGWT